MDKAKNDRSSATDFQTPMMQQYLQIKSEYPDALLFFRLGDFYELFLDDAKIGAEVLNITLTQRPRGKDGNIPMAGVPYHAAEPYLAKLVDAGHKVAICEQVTEPDGRSLVDREVVRIVTPGTVLDENSLPHKANNFLMSLVWREHNLALALADLSTGEFQIGEFTSADPDKVLLDLLKRFQPRECLLSPTDFAQDHLRQLLQTVGQTNLSAMADWASVTTSSLKSLEAVFGISLIKNLGLKRKPLAVEAGAALVAYLESTQKQLPRHLKSLRLIQASAAMGLDASTITNLELFQTTLTTQQRGSFLHFFDRTLTSMGGRRLRQWVLNPLTDLAEIKKRQDLVQIWLQDVEFKQALSKQLQGLPDIERILAKLALGKINPKDVRRFILALQKSWQVRDLMMGCSHRLDKLGAQISTKIQVLIESLDETLVEDPPFDPKQGGLIKSGVDQKLDEWSEQINSVQDWMLAWEKSEKQKTGITTLKVKFNKVFGYYLEVSKSYLKQVPDSYERKQTLVNAERFTTPELKAHERLILQAQELSQAREYQLFIELIDQILSLTVEIQATAGAVAEIDCLLSLTEVAALPGYTRPQLNQTGQLKIRQGRHPVLEQLTTPTHFVPNDVLLNSSDHQLLILTGPNMAGKSVLMRQTALIVLMAHLGSWVPADAAEICLVDMIAVRSGAGDNITQGMSTFMVEMVETAAILNSVTENSLVILDEIGRGTSTYDGISIAWALAEHLVTREGRRPKTLFATHYHELQDLEDHFPQKIKNYHVLVEEKEGQLNFLYTLVPGRAPHSFGVAVASLAGIPQVVTKRAQQLLAEFEHSHSPK